MAWARNTPQRMFAAMLYSKESWLVREAGENGSWTVKLKPRFVALRFKLQAKCQVHEQLDWLALRGYITYEPSVKQGQPIVVTIPAIQPHDGSGYTWGAPGRSPNPKAGTRKKKPRKGETSETRIPNPDVAQS